MVGDRYLTDIVFGNRLGMLTVRTEPLTLRGEPKAVLLVKPGSKVMACWFMGCASFEVPIMQVSAAQCRLHVVAGITQPANHGKRSASSKACAASCCTMLPASPFKFVSFYVSCSMLAHADSCFHMTGRPLTAAAMQARRFEDNCVHRWRKQGKTVMPCACILCSWLHGLLCCGHP